MSKQLETLLEVRQLDAVISILEDLKIALPRPTVSPGAKSKALAKAIDRLDDLRELLAMPRIGGPFVANPDPAISFTRLVLVLALFGALALVTCSVQVGILHGRASCPAPNVARMGP